MAETNSEVDVDTKEYGCSHYKRRCKLICPSCKKDYACRICHDDKENHSLDRYAVENIICTECQEKQQVQEKCSKCGVLFGNYFCKVCCLFDDEDKKQFHCNGCGLCRIGGRENFFHCEKCDMCLASDLRDNHKCIEKSSRSNCAVCLEDLHTSRIEAHIPKCGHLIHRTCFREMMKTGNYGCPICGEAMVDMKDVWKELDEEVANCPMPEEYKDFHVQILCKDCHKESNILFHVLGLKCSQCGSYNTCRSADPVNSSNPSAEPVNSSNPSTEPVNSGNPSTEPVNSGNPSTEPENTSNLEQNATNNNSNEQNEANNAGKSPNV